MLHMLPGASDFDLRRQFGELELVTGSVTAPDRTAHIAPSALRLTHTEVRPSMPCLLPAVTTKIRTRSRCFPDRVTALLSPDVFAVQPSLAVHFPGGGRTGHCGGAP